MNYKNILFGLILTLLIFNTSFVFAENKDIRYYYDNISEIKENINDNINNTPKAIQKIIQNDKLQIEIITENERLNLFLEKTNDGNFTVVKEVSEKANVWITSKEETINRIIDSPSPIDEITEAINNKDITIETKGIFRKIKFTITKWILKLKG